MTAVIVILCVLAYAFLGFVTSIILEFVDTIDFDFDLEGYPTVVWSIFWPVALMLAILYGAMALVVGIVLFFVKVPKPLWDKIGSARKAIIYKFDPSKKAKESSDKDYHNSYHAAYGVQDHEYFDQLTND